MRKLFLLLLSALLISCSSQTQTTPQNPTTIANIAATQIPATPVPSETTAPAPTQAATATQAAAHPTNTATAAITSTAGPTPTLAPDAWKEMPVVPEGISQSVKLIYEMGLLKGNNPQAYSKVGDCNMTMPYFMGDFDTPGSYQLGEYGNLQETIDFFAGSHGHKSFAAKDGLTAHAALSILWNTWKECESYETPLTCEYRLHRPMYAIISFGTNDAKGTVDFDKAMRRVIEMTIGNGTVPILATKADNAEGDNSINRMIVELAYEYQLPVWNYWAAVQSLPNTGLQDIEHMEHLSVSPAGYTNFEEDNLKYGWSMRNLTALQVLNAVRKAVEQQP